MLKKILNKILISSFLSYFINTSLNNIVRILYFYFITFIVPPNIFGESDLIISISTLMFSSIFFDQWIINLRDKIQQERDFNSNFDLFVISLFLYLIGSLMFSYFFSLNFYLLFLYGCSHVLNQYFFYFLRSLKLIKHSILISIFSNILFLLSSIVFIYLSFDYIFIVILPIIFYNFSYAFFVICFHFRVFKINFKLNTLNILHFWRKHFYLFFNSIFYWFLTSFISFYLYYFFSPTQLGIYSVALKFSSIFAIFLSAINALLQESNFSTKIFDSSKLKLILILLFPILVMLTPLFIFSYELIFLNDFKIGSTYIPYSVFIILMQFLSSFFGSFNLSRNNLFPIFISTLISGILNILLIFILSSAESVSIPLLINFLAWTVNVLIRILAANKFLRIKLNYFDWFVLFLSFFIIFIDLNSSISIFYFVFLIFIVTIYLAININNAKKSN